MFCVCAPVKYTPKSTKNKTKTSIKQRQIFASKSKYEKRCICDHLIGHLDGRETDAVGVAEEEHTLAFTGSTLHRLNPLAGTGACPHGLEEANPASLGLSAVVVAHDTLDGLGGLIGVVEGDVADIVVQDVGLNDTVEDVAADETEVTIDGGSGSTGEVPDLGLVVGESGVGVLEEGNGD